MKITKKSLFMSVMSLILCVAMLLGTTFAWFTDSVQSGKNTITAGNLDIEVYHTNANVTDEKIDGQTNLFKNVTLWEPGAVSYENFTVKNVGSLAAKYTFDLDVADKNSLDGHDLTEVIKVAVVEGGFDASNGRDVSGLTFETLADFQKLGNLAASTGSDTYGVVLYWEPTDNDNLYNVNNGATTDDGQSSLFIDFGISVVATQMTSESDSFDSQYDVNATYPILAPIVNETKFGKVTSSATNLTITSTVGTSTIQPANDQGIQIKTSAKTTDSSDTKTDYAMAEESTLSREIKTTASTADSVTYDISYIYTENGTSYDVSEFADVVTNVITLSTGLKNVKVTHTHGSDTTPMTEVTGTSDANYGKDGYFYYDSENGQLTIWSSKYSSFAVSYQSDFTAAVSGQGYATPAEAFAAAKNGDTVVVLQDYTFAALTDPDEDYEAIVLADNVTIDLNGKTLTCPKMSCVLDGKNLTIKNGTFAGTASYPLFIGDGNSGSITVKDVTITGGINIYKSTATLSNVKADASEKSYYAIWAEGGSVVTVLSGDYKAGASGLAIEKSASTISVTGGTFSSDPTAYVASGKMAKKQSNGTWNVVNAEYWKDNATAVAYGQNITINSAEELAGFAANVNSGKSYKGYTVTLGTDTDLSGYLWNPIGGTFLYTDKNGKDIYSAFDGTFDGAGHTVSNLTAIGEKKVGLFGASSICTIKNITVDGATVTGINHVAAITGYAICCNIENCHVKNAVITTNVKDNDDGDKAGAIVGYFTCEGNGHVSGCTATNCTVKGYRDVGGLIGYVGCYSSSNAATAYVTGNTVTNCTVICDKSNDYKSYTSKNNDLSTGFDVNALIGDTTDDGNINNTTMDIANGNTTSGCTVKFA